MLGYIVMTSESDRVSTEAFSDTIFITVVIFYLSVLVFIMSLDHKF